MSILDKLKEDHDKVREILKKATVLIEQYPKVDVKGERNLMKELLSELEPHSKAEEKVFYTALRKKAKNILSPYEGLQEHKLALQVLKGLQKDQLDKSQRSANMKVLKEMLMHHIEEEESTYFKEAEQCFTSKELQVLGEEFLENKQKIVNSKK
ncbi:MAG: hemerythrin domain-containing protein [Bacteroidetes bacterium]|nr:hemerythrin domain-containing protein [Bacteroidota bacterium]